MSISREFITSRSPSWRNLAILNSVWRRFTNQQKDQLHTKIITSLSGMPDGLAIGVTTVNPTTLKHVPEILDGLGQAPGESRILLFLFEKLLGAKKILTLKKK